MMSLRWGHRTRRRSAAAPDLSNVIFLDDYRIVTLVSTRGDRPVRRIANPTPPGHRAR